MFVCCMMLLKRKAYKKPSDRLSLVDVKYTTNYDKSPITLNAEMCFAV